MEKGAGGGRQTMKTTMLFLVAVIFVGRVPLAYAQAGCRACLERNGMDESNCHSACAPPPLSGGSGSSACHSPSCRQVSGGSSGGGGYSNSGGSGYVHD